MDFEFSADQELLRDSVRRYLADRAPIDTYVRPLIDDERGLTDDCWRGLAELGVVGLLVPEEYGGAGGGMVDAGVVLEEIGRAVHPGPYAATAVGATSLVLAAGEAEDHARLLPGLADGSTIATLALYEPDSRHRWQDPTTDAKLVEGTWRLSGTKTHVHEAAAADTVFVTAATDDGLGVFEVAVHDAQMTVEPTVDPTRRFASVSLSDTPATRVGEGDATDAVAEAVDRMTVAAVVDGIGAAGRALEMAVAYAGERIQFDQPIGSFQAVQHLCADMLHDLELARAGAYYALWAADAAPAEERYRAASMAKAFASDALARVGGSAIQVFGGVGFTWEHDIHLFYKRLLTLQHDLGGAVEHREAVAGIILAD